jgi:hypothetical protein
VGRGPHHASHERRNARRATFTCPEPPRNSRLRCWSGCARARSTAHTSDVKRVGRHALLNQRGKERFLIWKQVIVAKDRLPRGGEVSTRSNATSWAVDLDESDLGEIL